MTSSWEHASLFSLQHPWKSFQGQGFKNRLKPFVGCECWELKENAYIHVSSNTFSMTNVIWRMHNSPFQLTPSLNRLATESLPLLEDAASSGKSYDILEYVLTSHVFLPEMLYNIDVTWVSWRLKLPATRSLVDSPHEGQWRGALMLSLICVWTNGWASSRDAGDLERHRAHYGVTVVDAVVIGLDHDTVGAGVVGTAQRVLCRIAVPTTTAQTV